MSYKNPANSNFRNNTGDTTYKSGNTIDVNSKQATPIVYPTPHPENFAGTNTILISKDTTLNAVIDATFATDSAVATLTSQLVSITSSAWTPTITGGTEIFSTTISNQSGFYKKIGNIVTFTLYAHFASKGTPSTNGSFQFNLPIAPNNNFTGTSFGIVVGTATLSSGNNGPCNAVIYTKDASKLVYFDGSRGTDANTATDVFVNGQYNINN